MVEGRQKDNIYSTMQSMINKKVPDLWKWKWLCLEWKIDSEIPTSNDLRPLYLQEGLKKLWERLLLRRKTSA